MDCQNYKLGLSGFYAVKIGQMMLSPAAIFIYVAEQLGHFETLGI